MKQRNSDRNSHRTQKHHPVMSASIKHLLLLLVLCITNTWAIAQNAPVAIGDINNTLINTQISGNVLTNDFDQDGDNLILTTTPIIHPSNGAIVINPDGSYTYTPIAGFTGTDQFQYEVCDDGLPSMCDTSWCTIQVFEKLNGQNNAPVANNDYYHTTVNSVTIGSVLSNDFDLDGDSLVVNTTPVSAPVNGTMTLNMDGTFAYVAHLGFTGTDEIVYQICDNNTNSLCSQGIIFIRVLDTLASATNQKPTAVDDAVITSYNTFVNGNILINDSDVNSNNLSSQLVQTTFNGIVILNTDGTFTYLPYTGFVGTDWFTYQTCDDGNPVLCDTATLYISIVPYLSINVTTVNESTCGAYDGQITISTLSNNNLEYSIDGGNIWSSSPQFSNLLNGVYHVKVRNTSTSEEYSYINNPVLINAPNSPQIDSVVTVNPSSCNIKNGSLEIYASGSSTGYKYSLSGINGVFQYYNDFQNLGGNIFDIAVTDGNNTCTTTYAMPIEITPLDNGYVANTNVTNVSDCNQIDGLIEVNSSSLHTGIIEYTIDDGLNWQTSPIFSNLSSGHYKFKTRHDESNCSYSEDLTIQSATQPVITTIDKTFTSGCNVADGTLTIHASADSALLYSIDNGTTWQTDSVFSGLNHGNYYIAVKKIDGSCITYWQEDGYYEYGYYLPNHGPNSTLTQTGDGCGTNDGYIHVINNYHHGYPNYVHSIDGGLTWQSSLEFNNLSSGTYYLTIKHALDTCISIINRPFVIVDKVSPSISNIAKVDATNCSTNDGSITVSVSGTAQPYFSIDGGLNWQADSVFSNLALGNYSVVVRDSTANCTDTVSTWVTILATNAPMITDISFTSPTDCNNNNGTITITSTSGIAPLEYSIDNGMNWLSNGGLFTGLSGGTYCVKVRNASGTCEVSHFECIQLENKLPTTINDIYKEAPTNCAGNSGYISIDYAYSTPYSVEFSIDSGLTWQSNSYFGNLWCGTYHGMMRYQDGSCATYLGQIDLILANDAPIFYNKTIYTISQAIVSTDVLASSVDPNGDQIVYDTILVQAPTNGTIVFNTDGTFTYQSASGFVGTEIIKYQGCDVPTNTTFSSLCATGQITIHVSQNLSPVAGDDYITTCSNININALVNDYDSNYTTPITITNIVQSPTGGTAQIINNATGGYIYYEPTTIATTPNARDTIAYEICDGGTPSLCDIGFIYITIDAVINPIDSITYTDINCDSYGTITFHKNSYGNFEYSIDGGVTYQYYYKDFENLQEGTYQPFYRNYQNNQYCTVDLPAITIQNTTAVIDSVTTVLPTQCGSFDGSLTVFPDSIHYEYSIDGNNWQSVNHFSNLLTGTYEVKVRDTTTNCSSPVYSYFVSLIMSGDSIPSITNVQVSDVTDCGASDGTITIYNVATSSPVEYSIDSGQTWSSSTSSSNKIFTGLTPDVYYPMTRKSTDTLCISIHSPVNVNGKISPIITNVVITYPSSCGVSDGSITVTATGIYLEYSIDGGLHWESSGNFTGLSAGTYNVAVRNTDETCPIFYTNNPAIITIVGAPTITNVSSTNPTDCSLNNGAITITTTGGSGVYEYSIDGFTWQASNSFTGLSGGTYSVCSRNSDGTCTTCNSSVTLVSPTSPIITNVVTTNPTDCNLQDGTITINATGLSTEYSLDGGTTWQSSNTFIGLLSGSYQVKVRNSDGTCEVDYIGNMLTLTASVTPVINGIATTDPSNCGVNDGAIIIAATGTSLEYSITGGLNWQASNVFNGLDAGTYNIVIRNSNGTCVTPYTSNPVILAAPNSPVIPIVSSTNPTNCNTPNGTITINATGISLEYSIDGGFSFQASNIFTGLDALNNPYEVRVRNTDGTCLVSAPNVVLVAPISPIITSTTPVHPTNCILNDGTITINAVSGQGAIEYSIDGGTTWASNNGLFTNLGNGTYSICVRNINGTCEVCQTVTLAAPNTPTIVSVNHTNPTNCTNPDGTITITATGSGNIDYSIDGGATWSSNNVYTGLISGTYQICVRNDNGTCETCGIQVPLSSPLIPIITNVNYSPVTACGISDGTITIVASGLPSIEYSIDNMVWQASPNFTGVPEGIYTAYVRNNDGSCPNNSGLIDLTAGNSIVINNVTTGNPSQCGAADGTIIITATGGNSILLRYSIDGGMTYQLNNTFTGLMAGTYYPFVDNGTGNSCPKLSGPVQLENGLVPVTDYNIISDNVGCAGDTMIFNLNNLTSIGYDSFDITPSLGLIGTNFNANNLEFGVVPLAAGQYSYSITVWNANGCELNTTYSFIANNGPSVQAQDYTRCLNNTGNYLLDPSFILLEGGTIPTGATVEYSSTFGTFGNPTDPNTTFTPYNNVSGSVIITVAIDTGLGCPGLDAFTLNIVDTPVVNISDRTICATSSTILSAPTGVNYSWSVISGDINSLNNTTTNTVIATPSITTTYQVQVQNINGCIGMDLITVTVDNSCTNNAPIAVDDINVTLANTPVNGNVLINDSDPNGDNLIINVTPIFAPANGAVVLNTDGTYTYTPNTNFNGSDQFSYEVCDDGNPVMCDTATVTINVLLILNASPIATNDNFTMDENDTLYHNVMINDFDPDLDFLYTNTNPIQHPINGTVQIDSSGFFTYIPDSGYAGLDTFYYQLYDDGSPVAYDTGMVAIDILDIIVDPCFDCTPTAVDDATLTQMNVSVSGNVLVNDFVPSGDSLVLSLIPNTYPANGTVILYANGDFTYTPNLGFQGTDSLEYQVCNLYDTSFCDLGSLYISVVAPPNQAPIATDDYFNSSSIWNVLLNDFDPDGNNLKTDTGLLMSPLYGTATLDTNGLVTYIQTTWFNGLDSFIYQVCDDGNPSLCDTATVYVSNNFPNINIGAVSITNVSCPGESDGGLNTFVSGGSGNYEMSIDSGATWVNSLIVNNLPIGHYGVLVRDGFDTSSMFTAIISEAMQTPMITTDYSGDTMEINALTIGSKTYSVDSGLTWQNTNTFHPVSLANVNIGVTIVGMNSTCEFFYPTNITNTPPVVVDDNIYLPQQGYQSKNILWNDYDLENNALFTKPEVNYYGLDSLTIDSTGLITVPTNGLTLGSYMVTYETCELYNPTNCTQGTVFFEITAPKDTLMDTLVLSTTHTFCVPLTDLPGSFNSLTNLTTYPLSGAIVIDSIVNDCLYLYGDILGNDTVEVLVCDDLGFCDTTMLIFYVEDGVWPGDTDDDTQVDNFDLLNIGLGYGQIGTMRNNITNIWNGYRSPKWNVGTPMTNIDYRHADANGDGMVNSDDTLAIVLNWNKSYQKNTSSSALGGVPIYIDTTGAFASLPNLHLPIMLGTPSSPVTGLYGAAFSYEYDTTIYDTNASIDINTSWIGTKNLDLLSLSVNTPDLGHIDAAMTRIDGANVNGIGAIAYLNLTIRDDIFQRPAGGFNTDSLIFSFVLSNVKLISNDETDIPVDILTTGFTFYTSTENIGLGQFVNIFPNPTRDRVTIQTERLQIESYEILDMTGRLIFKKSVTPQNIHQVDLDGVPSGIYNLKMQTNEGIANKRIVIVR